MMRKKKAAKTTPKCTTENCKTRHRRLHLRHRDTERERESMSLCERVLRRVLKETNRDSLNESVCVCLLCQRVLKRVLKERKGVCEESLFFFFSLYTKKIGGNFAENFWTIDLKLFIIIYLLLPVPLWTVNFLLT
jgi:hypothetical protein